MNIEELAQRYANDFPGYKLVDFYEAAFPSYMIQLQVLMQVKRPIPVLEEFILKTVDAGFTSIGDIAGILGLEYASIEVGLDNLQRRNYVYFKVSDKAAKSVPVLITQKGRFALKELYLTEPEPGNYPVCMDALTGLLYHWEPLAQPSMIKEWGIHEIPSFVPTPKLEQIDFISLKRLVADGQRDLADRDEKRELVDLLGIDKLWTAYKRLRVLQYIRELDGAIMVQVFDKADRSIEHEAALINMEHQKLRPLRAVMEMDVPQSAESEFEILGMKKVEAARQLAVESPKIKKEIESKNQVLEVAKNLQSSEQAQDRREATFQIDQLNEQILKLESQLKELESQADSTEVLQMYEHRPKLLDALKNSKSQVIIVSPWLTTDAVNPELRQYIGKALQRGVNIIIAFGFKDANAREHRTIKKLKEVSKNKKGKLKLYRVGDLHSKVLISDQEYMVLTSFNWLSFEGDPIRGVRFEDGMLTKDKKAIKDKTDEWMQRVSSIQET